MSAVLKVPKNTVASIILKLKPFGTTQALPRAGHLAKLRNWGRRALVRKVTKKPMVILTELQSSSVELGEPSRRIIFSAALHQSGLYGSGIKYFSQYTLKYYLSRCLGYLYFTIYIFDNFYFTTFLKKIKYFLLHKFYLTPKSTHYILNA